MARAVLPLSGGDSLVDQSANSVVWLQQDPLTALESLATFMSCRRGQDIYGPGDPSQYWYRVVSGLAKKCAETASGQRQIVDFLMPGDFFGFTARTEHEFAVDVLVDGTVIARYPRRRLEMLADSNPELGRLIRQVAFKAIARLQERMLVLGRTTALEKVGRFLIEMADRFSDASEEVIVLPMSRYDIADYLAISVETVSRALTDLRHRGTIRFANTRRVRIVDRDALQEGRGQDRRC